MKSMKKLSAFPGWCLWVANLAGFRDHKESKKNRGKAGPAPPSAQKSQLAPARLSLDTFSGTVVRSGQHFALLNPDGVLYTLDSTGRAWSFEGEDVRVTGNLDAASRLIHIVAIESEFA